MVVICCDVLWRAGLGLGGLGGLVLDCFPHGSEVVHGGILAAFIFPSQGSSDQTGRVPILRFVGRPHRCSMGQICYDMAQVGAAKQPYSCILHRNSSL